MTPQHLHPQEMIDTLLADPDQPGADALANQLLGECHRGLPLRLLLPLLSSENTHTKELGVWIASELGEKGSVFLPYVSAWLSHPSKKIRFFAIDCVLLWAAPEDGPLIASVFPLLRDKESAVRWKASDFFFRLSDMQLRSALAFLEAGRALAASNPVEVEAGLASGDPAVRRLAAIAASRLAERDPALLLRASHNDNAEIADFAQSALAALKRSR